MRARALTFDVKEKQEIKGFLYVFLERERERVYLENLPKALNFFFSRGGLYNEFVTVKQPRHP